ncbi:peptide ABC transporter substrate-binding protein [Staphylococcus sp. SQ8-PEA]|uniref:Peptide ABC transporter substrate-binding protein n=1 Tax=Staphylococcus marylandisciuri TaxID=2981529 RepID=A0ABT2QPT1_9STAP|nr:peptide ABC transporter substrate-binding protein [Staphylococcus marylandisciuri]MCU5745986.1 peptide ABC transporter substrate-binding protein [Staphylococcus marylandisciuri]
MKLKCLKTFSTLVAALFVLSGCGTKSLYDDKGQVYRSTLAQDMSTLDSVMATDNVSFTMFNQLYEGLYVLDKNDKAIPGVAKKMPNISNGEKRYTIELRKDAKWSNGDPVTADDFVYSWRKAVNPKTGSEYAFIMNYLKNAEEINSGKKPVRDLGVKAINKYKLQIDLEKPVPYFNELLAFGTYMPQDAKIAKKEGDQYGTKVDRAVYNGPFKLVKWAPENKIEMIKNDKYWDKKSVKLDKVNYKILKDQQAGASLYETGSVDNTGITAEQVDKYKDSPALFKRLNASTFFLKMNEKEVPEFKNKDLRYAIAQSVNKQAYVDNVLGDGSKPFDNFTAKKTTSASNSTTDYADTVKSPLKYDTKAAKTHLEKAKKALGKDNFTFTLNTEDTPSSKISAEYIKSDIEKNLPGVTVKIKQMPFKQRVNAELSMSYQMSLSGWGPDYPDPTSFLEVMVKDGAQNNTDWSNKNYDSMLKEANGSLLTKEKERMDKLTEAEELLLQEAPVAPIYQQGKASLRSPQVKGIVYHYIGGEMSLKHAYIDKSIDRKTGDKKKEGQ